MGQVVRERREQVYVATKIPPKNLEWPARRGVSVRDTFPASHIARFCDKSLRNLGREQVDLLQLHVWQDAWLDEEGWQDAWLGLRTSGKARFLGLSVNDHDPGSALRAVASGLFDTVQVIYNIFDPTPAAELLPLCAKHGVGVLARVPFDEGGLTGAIRPDTTFPEGDFRNEYFGGERRREWRSLLERRPQQHLDERLVGVRARQGHGPTRHRGRTGRSGPTRRRGPSRHLPRDLRPTSRRCGWRRRRWS